MTQPKARPRPLPTPVLQVYGEVISLAEGTLRVSTDAGPVDARRAHSCMIEPIVGDRVLVSVPQIAPRDPSAPASIAQRGYVLAVLERRPGAPNTVALDGDLTLAPTGRLTMSSPIGVDVTSPEHVSVAAREIRIESDAARAVLGGLKLLAAKLEARVGETTLVGGAIQSVFERVTQTMRSSFRVVEETDRLEVRDATWSATDTLDVRSGNTILTAEQLVKVDGDQIHLG